MSESGDLRVGICAIAKDEGSYFEEWVGYHHLMGFDPIRIYAHECADNSHAVLTRLAKYGLCEWVPFTSPSNRKPQWLAYGDAMEELRDRTDWLAFIDLDEMIVTPRHTSIQAFLAEYGHLGAIAMNWKIFGSSGRKERGKGLMMERFTRCAPKDFKSNKTIKTLARTDTIEIPRVHTCHFKPGVVYQTVLEEPIPEQVGYSEQVDHDAIRVNHYFTRSLEEWESKATRGRGAKRPNSPIKHRTMAEFERLDRNEEEDTVILRWADPVKQLIVEIDSADLDDMYARLETSDRRIQQLEAERDQARQALARAEERLAIAHRALYAEQSRLDAVGAAVGRIADSATWRVGSRIIRLGRLLTFRRTRGDSALDVAARQLGVPEPESPTSVASLTSQTSTAGR